MLEQRVSLASNGVVKVPGYEQLLHFGHTKNRGVYRIAVTATGEWDGLTIRAFWHVPDGFDPASSLVADGYVDVPASVTAQSGNGCITFEGSDGTKTVTSADLRYRVSANSGTEDGAMPEPGTPAWQQLVDAVHTDATAAEQAKTNAQTAAQQAGAFAQKAGQALSDTTAAKENALKSIGDKQTTATQAVDTARDKAIKQVESSTKAAQTAASEAATSAGNASQSAQEAAGSLKELKDGIASGDFKGEPGNDGESPVVTVTSIENGHRVSITDKDGTKTIDVLNGQTGKTGATPVLTIGTVSSGDKPSANITGTPENPVLNLMLQPGPQGPAVALDPTLSVSGKAADAAKVREAVNAETERAKGVESQIKEDIKYELGKKIINLFDYKTATINAYMDHNKVTESKGYYFSDYIEVKPSTEYCIPYTVNVLGSAYDKNKEYINVLRRSDKNQPSGKYSVFTTSGLTKYIRVNGYCGTDSSKIITSPTNYMLVESDEYPDFYHIYNEKPLFDSYSQSNYLYSKTLLTYGDSITEGVAASTDSESGYKKTYAGLVAIRNSMNFVNLGWSGSTMADDGKKPFIHNGDIYSHFDNKLITPDYITVWFGWNDYAHAQNGTGITLGKMGDTSESTYYGAYTKACELLIKKFPKARIGLIVPYGMNKEWREAVRVVAKKFGLPYLDLYNNCPCIFDNENGVNTNIAELRKTTFLADGTHPNDDGYEWISTAYEEFLRRI